MILEFRTVCPNGCNDMCKKEVVTQPQRIHMVTTLSHQLPFGSAEVSTTSLESVDGPSNISFQDLNPAAGALEGWTGTLRNGDKACSLIGSSPRQAPSG